MATSSFNKDFSLNTKKVVGSFEKIISTSTKSVKINKELFSHESERQGEQKLKQMIYKELISGLEVMKHCLAAVFKGNIKSIQL